MRTAAKIIDVILIAAAMEVIPKAGYFAGLAYLLLGDGFFDGRSLGKKLIRLQVLSKGTLAPCSFKESILRNSTLAIGYLLWGIPLIGWVFILGTFCVEFVLILGSNDGERLGDVIAGTMVVET